LGNRPERSQNILKNKWEKAMDKNIRIQNGIRIGGMSISRWLRYSEKKICQDPKLEMQTVMSSMSKKTGKRLRTQMLQSTRAKGPK